MTKEEYMALALSVAESTIGQTSPNPSVGAVVVKGGRIIGIGSHLQAGKEHAEVHALAQAGEGAEGGEIYVTLEPCVHFGKTPPCADLIIKHKLKKVYIACLDPNPAVAGKGVAKLEQAGIEVEIGLGEARALELNRKFFYFMKTRRPYVTLKAAMTLDGKTATSSGDSKWITSEEARLDVHKERDIHDAILVGSQTVIKDNPQLTTRLPQGGKNPIRIILDTNLSIHDDARILDQVASTWIICGNKADVETFSSNHPHIEVMQLPADKIRISDVLDVLGEKGVQSLYVEGGSTIHGAFVREQLFQECHWYIAPKLLGGANAITAVGGESPLFMNDASSLTFTSVEQIGPDIKVVARPKEAR
ncbi:bifunctional diaminohydroxyphosphoribosylaminopyrimidine deaminase/5-amino-6-(5-phosphoribosylamino)uracil reductase RibD [Aquibacillus koreensis]|uniref:Riboflavin biosynthesis protein RibD n=1 Tax=Aquibacillus koreensis TaxID=279446 RepID=A0A9X4AJN6_9BACI|nr:bifunctional diaminohydroxyphosphoribosylaminopyrimidine deaminase/5-amino-6-(5-phosphoribosylamino)uracil reductase RibD [Aquibacillus koreensis]MCT2534905.1 bifunctional diaminohydroxyphosphoribosylaminopyrimidine deaminase/5-amino-6-(5-phosphoribosylamino)uracil reductase RibD [Aquibacillus koreensis]MDC3422201.1 bifunctional diaminohydroxyphosphoribosylaminopyrimidine deaminase/5-amino-6-(5-phosphoribosylamino)uracil reductase RibD [Aquibacillus koreensis]